MEVTKQDDAWHSDGLGAARIGGHPPVVGLARFSYRVLPKPNDLVEDLGHHARVRPGSGRCHLADCRAAATTAGRDAPAGVSPAPGSWPGLLPGDPDPAGDRRVVGRHRGDPRSPGVRYDAAGIDQFEIQRRGTKVPGVKRQPLRLGLRWVVEATNTWWSNYGQLRRNTDRRPCHCHAALCLATAILIVGRLIDWRNRWSPR